MYLFIVVLLVGIVSFCEAGFATGGSQYLMEAARSQAFADVDVAYKSTIYRVKKQSLKFAAEGSITQSVHAKESGNDTSHSLVSVVGFAANQCTAGSDYFFKFQLEEDSCEGAVIQYFKDVKCDHVVAVSTVESLTVASGDLLIKKLDCTTKPSVVFGRRAVIAAEFYTNVTHEGQAVQHVALPLRRCFPVGDQALMYTCRGYAILDTFANRDCSGEPSNAEFVSHDHHVPLLPPPSPLPALPDLTFTPGTAKGVADTDEALYGVVQCRTLKPTKTV